MRTVALALGVLVGTLTVASPANAGGSWYATVQASHEPGDVVTLVGYTSDGDWITADSYEGWLTAARLDDSADPRIDPDFALRVGTVTVERTGEGGWAEVRASITFTLPTDIPDGVYGFTHCHLDCTDQLGELVGGAVYVGVDNPNHAVTWPESEPELVNLPPETLLYGPGQRITVGEFLGDAPASTSTVSPTTTVAAETTTTEARTTTTTEASTATTTTVDSTDEAAAPVIVPGDPTAGSDDGGVPIGIAALTIVVLGLSGAVVWFVRSARGRQEPTSAPIG